MFRLLACLLILPGVISSAVLGDFKQTAIGGCVFLSALWFSGLYRLECPNCLWNGVGFRKKRCPRCGVSLQEE